MSVAVAGGHWAAEKSNIYGQIQEVFLLKLLLPDMKTIRHEQTLQDLLGSLCEVLPTESC